MIQQFDVIALFIEHFPPKRFCGGAIVLKISTVSCSYILYSSKPAHSSSVRLLLYNNSIIAIYLLTRKVFPDSEFRNEKEFLTMHLYTTSQFY